jgi:F-type H+-transporting ATPase subunit gamma
MASMRQIRSRIRVAKNIQQITKAMKMVAAARLRRAQETVEASRPYATRLREVMSRLAASGGSSVQHPLLRPTSANPRSIGVVLISGDRGLCGSFNSNAIRRGVETVKGFDTDSAKFITVGRRGTAFFRRRGYTIVSENLIPPAAEAFAASRQIAAEAIKLFESGTVDVVYLVYTQFVSAMTQRSQAMQLLPVATPAANPGAIIAGSGPSADVIFEPSAEEILIDLVPRYVDTLVFQGIVESTASFFGAQMTSMSSATDNAGKMIDILTLNLNRARQAAITKEIAEIVGGADALRG